MAIALAMLAFVALVYGWLHDMRKNDPVSTARLMGLAIGSVVTNMLWYFFIH